MFCAVWSRGKSTFKPVVNPLLSTIERDFDMLRTFFMVIFCKAWLLLMSMESTDSRLSRPSNELSPVLVMRIDCAFVTPTFPKFSVCRTGRAVRFNCLTKLRLGILMMASPDRKLNKQPPVISFNEPKVIWARSCTPVIVRLPSIFWRLSTWICWWPLVSVGVLRPVWIATEPEYVVHEANAVASAEAVMVVVPEMLQSAAVRHIGSVEAPLDQEMMVEEQRHCLTEYTTSKCETDEKVFSHCHCHWTVITERDNYPDCGSAMPWNKEYDFSFPVDWRMRR